MINTPKNRILTRSNGVKIRRDRFKSKIQNDFEKQLSTRHNYFFSRITLTWNALPKKIVQAQTLKMFKKGFDDRFKAA